MSSGRKRAFETLMRAEYAKYGVTDGVLSNQRERRSCGIIVKGWPSWCMAATTRGWDVKLIVIKDNEWEREIRVWFPMAIVVEYERINGCEASVAYIEVWFSDLDPPQKLNLWISQAHFIITSRRARTVSKPWQFQLLSISHAACGGVTSGSWIFYIYHKDDNLAIIKPAPVAGRDLSTILNTKQEGMPCPKPATVPTSHQQVIQLRPNTFHGGGLLPWGGFRLKIVAPCIFSQTGWVRRQLSGSEMLRALDVPEEMETELKSNQIRQICADVDMIPLKVTVSILDALPCWEPDLGEVGSRPKQPKRVLDGSPSAAGHVINGAVGSTPVTESMKDRDAKATKSDDAAIPEYHWNRKLSPSLDPQVVKALAGLRKFAWLWWYRHLEREFMHWFMTNYPITDIEQFLLNFPGCKKHVAAHRDWLAGMDCLQRSRRSNWWEWSDGSRPYFWRWTPEYVEIIRDGLPIWELDDLPTWFVPQRAVRVP
jgi:hypothetical protein